MPSIINERAHLYTSTPPFVRSRATQISVFAAVFVLAFIARWLTYNGLGGDDHWSLWTASVFLKGDLPFRDFVELGDPAYWGMSAIAQYITGYRVIGEVVLGTTLIALGVALGFHMAWQASRSLAIAAIVTCIAMLLVTGSKLYVYQKVFLYPFGLWLCWRYIDKPTLLRAAALAAGVVFAWGYRHDHGIYVGIGAATAVLATHWKEGARQVGFAWARFGIVLLLIMAPYLTLIQVNEGVIPYIRERLRIARMLDTAGRKDVWFNPDATAPPHWLRIDPPRPAHVIVDWKPEVTPETRMSLERQYSLTNGVDPKQRMYEYFLTDVSPDILAALITDARIVDRKGISQAFREMPDGSRVRSDITATQPPESDAPPEARAIVSIQWSATLAAAERAALERQYRLLDPTPTRNKWDYSLADVSTSNIRAIVEDPHVYDTGLLFRDTFRPMEESSLVRLQRAIPLLRVSIAPRYWHPVNGAVWLYWLSFALPVIVLVMLGVDWIRGRTREGMPNAAAKLFAAAVMVEVVDVALLRKAGNFSEHADVIAVLGAFVLGSAFASFRWRSLRGGLTAAVAAIALVVSTSAAIIFVSPFNALALAGFNDGWHGAWAKARGSFESYATSPPIDEYAPPGTTGDRGLLRYIYECTRPDDRIWLLTETYTVPYYTERRVVGHIYWSMGLLATPEYERRIIDQVDKEEVPFIMSFGGDRPFQNLESYPLVHEYAQKRYTTRHAIPEDKVDRGLSIWLLTDGRRKPTGTYELFGLPCFK